MGTIGFAGVVPSGPAAAASCLPAGTTGYTAAVLADAGQTISGTVDATGCDIGVFIGPDVNGVTITNATVENANDHGIEAKDDFGVTIENSTVQNNGVNPHFTGEDKAIQLDGVSGAMVQDNLVQGNTADGGISVADDGPTDPGGLNPGPNTPVPSTNDTITGNTILNNYGGCGIVLAAFNPGGGLNGITASNNTITGQIGHFGRFGPVIGQIVIAGDAPQTDIENTTVTGNTISQSFIDGIVLHSNAPGDVINKTTIAGNNLSLNNWGGSEGPPTTSAMALIGNPFPPGVPPATVSNTSISGNTMTQQYFGVWIGGSVTGTSVGANSFQGAMEVFTAPVPGSGVWVAGRDGGVVTLGAASFFGSLVSQHVTPAAPVAGIAPTRDGGGYRMVGADGGVFNFGDAAPVRGPGSLPAMHVVPKAPIVGIATTPPGGFGTPVPTNGLGYWMVSSDGGVFNFGDAPFYGSAGAVHLAKPIVGMVPTQDGQGYWLVASDGGVFTYGSAKFFGSTGAMHLNAPIVAMIPSLDDHGYLLIASDGGVFTFGDAHFEGSLGGSHLGAPIVGAQKYPLADGYWLVDANGNVSNFGAAPAMPGGGGKEPAGAVTGMAITPSEG